MDVCVCSEMATKVGGWPGHVSGWDIFGYFQPKGQCLHSMQSRVYATVLSGICLSVPSGHCDFFCVIFFCVRLQWFTVLLAWLVDSLIDCIVLIYSAV